MKRYNLTNKLLVTQTIDKISFSYTHTQRPLNIHIPDFYVSFFSYIHSLSQTLPQEDPQIYIYIYKTQAGGARKRSKTPVPSQRTEILFHFRIPNTPLTPRANYEMSRVNRPSSPLPLLLPPPLLLFSQRYRKLRQGRGPWRPRHHATAEAEAVEEAARG